MTNLDVVNKLIGNIRPVGESNTDAERYENLKAMCELTEQLIKQIGDVWYDFKDDRQASIKRSSMFSRDFLVDIINIPVDTL